MKRLVLTGLTITAASLAIAQTTIYKHVDEQGRVTYSNVPIKGAAILELDPLTTMPLAVGDRAAAPVAADKPAGAATAEKSVPANAPEGSMGAGEKAQKPQRTALVTATSYPNVDSATQRKRDDVRRRILEEELRQEEKLLAEVRGQLSQEQQNPTLIQAVRLAQETAQPTPAQQLELRQSVDKASSKIRTLQQSAGQHEKNLVAIRKELSSLKN
jgi:hypothetical protein